MSLESGFLTDKQYKILTVLCDGNGQDEQGNFIPADIDELLERLSYKTSKPSMQFSIRPLVRAKYIEKGYEKRRGAQRVLLIPTKLARKVMGRMLPAFIEPEDLEAIDIS